MKKLSERDAIFVPFASTATMLPIMTAGFLLVSSKLFLEVRKAEALKTTTTTSTSLQLPFLDFKTN